MYGDRVLGFRPPEAAGAENSSLRKLLLTKINFAMQNLGINASVEQKQALASSEAYAAVSNLSIESIARAATNTTFEEGDELTIQPGYAMPMDITDSEDKFLGFEAQVKRNGRPLAQPVQISLKQLTTRTMSLEPLTNFKRNALSYRFGRPEINVEEIDVNGEKKKLFSLPNALKCKITLAKRAYVADRDTYDADNRSYGACIEKENYGYAKA